MFKEIGNKIICSEGWSVESKGRLEIVYKDKKGLVSVGAEMLAGGNAFQIFRKGILSKTLWWKTKVSQARLDEVIEKIQRAYNAVGCDIYVD